ncbi:hypothetical protein ACFE04_004550 [Oxalis oulophora]
MASPDIESESFDICFEEGVSADFTHLSESSFLGSTSKSTYNVPEPPPLPAEKTTLAKVPTHFKRLFDNCSVPKETKATWDKLFVEGYGADVCIITEDDSHVMAHSSFLSVASPVLRSVVEEAKVTNNIRCFKILGVPVQAVCAFIRFLYSSCYEVEEMNKFVLHLLVLSHYYSVPSLKSVCVHHLEHGLLTKENAIDVLQLARSCDAPRLYFICTRMVVKEFKTISSTEGWKVMKRANPALEQELVESIVEADSRKQERLRKIEEKIMYLQLNEAMEALLHICRDGCRSIGPCDKVLTDVPCNFPACKVLEALVRHFSGCKARVPGGCVHCKRMWQLLDLHSRMCSDPDFCKVPLCRHFKEKTQQQSKKEEAKWRLLVSKVIAAKNSLGPFSARDTGLL